MHSMQWYACQERFKKVGGNYEEDTVSNDDENDGIPEGTTRSPKGSLAPQGPRVTALQ